LAIRRPHVAGKAANARWLACASRNPQQLAKLLANRT